MLSASQQAQTRALRHLMPPGRLWLEPGSQLYRLLQALGDELGRVQERGLDLVEEADPRTATQTLSEWERLLGLPDDAVVTIPVTDAARRLAIVQKLTASGGQSRAFFQALALACGYTVTITDGFSAEVCRAGVSRAGARVYGLERAYYWRVTVQPPGGSALSHAELEAIIRRAAPAHTTLSFVYL